ncbi:flagellar hook protein FlgE [Tessaracoccus sp.]
MLRSLFSAVTGMRANQAKMDVIANNIANVNTAGFKGSDVIFQDTLSQALRAGGAPAAGRGGSNPAQVGLGVQVAGITTNFVQGAAQNTGRANDLMINGDGFFVVKNSAGEQLYTRSGAFSFDGVGNLTSPDGSILQGLKAVSGVIDPNGALGDLKIPFGSSIPPVASTAGLVQGNLPANALIGTIVNTGITMYDNQGGAHPITFAYTKTAANAWKVDVTDDGVAQGTQAITFDASGDMTAPALNTFTFTPTTAGWTGPVSVDMTKMNQYGGASTIAATEQDGYATGTLQSFSMGNDGVLSGVYSNGQRQNLGQVLLAGFNNPAGLEKAGNSMYRAGVNAGQAQIGLAGTSGRGALSSGVLEMSNVDLGQEFTNLIVAQRGFQATTRVITASDEILQDVVNLKR